MHIHIVHSIFFTKSISAPQGDTLGRINTFSINSCNYNLSSNNASVLMRYGDFEDGTEAGVSSMEKYKSHFGGNPSISSVIHP